MHKKTGIENITLYTITHLLKPGVLSFYHMLWGLKCVWYKKLKKILIWYFWMRGREYFFLIILDFDLFKNRSAESDKLYYKLVWPFTKVFYKENGSVCLILWYKMYLYWAQKRSCMKNQFIVKYNVQRFYGKCWNFNC